jgi:hypothetical protein
MLKFATGLIPVATLNLVKVKGQTAMTTQRKIKAATSHCSLQTCSSIRSYIPTSPVGRLFKDSSTSIRVLFLRSSITKPTYRKVPIARSSKTLSIDAHK